MTEIVTLPSYLTVKSIEQTLNACSEILDACDNVNINASGLKFVDPFGIAMLGSCLSQAKAYGFDSCISGLNKNVGSYLNRMDCFNDVELTDFSPSYNVRHDRSDSLVELKKLEDVKMVNQVSNELAKALVGSFNNVDLDLVINELSGYTLKELLINTLQYPISELLENSLTHARRNGYCHTAVWVAGQYFKSRGIVQISVIDNGCGFLSSLKGHSQLQTTSHLDAILTALKPRVSCNRDLGIMGDSVNQGVGLTTTVRIAEASGGRATILSGDAFHQTDGRSSYLSNDSWQGVAVSLVFSRSKLNKVQISELLPVLENEPEISLRFE